MADRLIPIPGAAADHAAQVADLAGGVLGFHQSRVFDPYRRRLELLLQPGRHLSPAVPKRALVS